MEENITSDEDNIEIVDKFAHLGNVLSTEGGAQEAARLRIRSGWMKFQRSPKCFRQQIHVAKD